jgi:hypothetical protein
MHSGGFLWGQKSGPAFATVLENGALIDAIKGLGFDVNQGDINLGALVAYSCLLCRPTELEAIAGAGCAQGLPRRAHVSSGAGYGALVTCPMLSSV